MPDGAGEGERTFMRYLDRIRSDVNERIAIRLSELDPRRDMDEQVDAMLGHGKRLRAGMAMLSFDVFSDDVKGRSIALDLAAAIEVAHSASLILDDLLDGDEHRRGLPALHRSKGEKKAVLEVIGLISIPYSIVAKHGEGYVEGLAVTQRRIVEGALEEIDVKPGSSPSRSYEHIIVGKTGDLFGLAARFGSSAAGCPPDLVDGMGRFGISAGKVMQIADDIADLRLPSNSIKRLGSPSELLLLRCGGPDETLAKAIMEAQSALDLVRDAAHDRWSGRLDDWKSLLRSAPPEIADLMLSEGRHNKGQQRHA